MLRSASSSFNQIWLSFLLCSFAALFRYEPIYMKAVIARKYGGPEVLQISTSEKPVPRSKEILIKISYATVSTGTVLLRRGKVPDSPVLTILMRLIFGIAGPRQQIPGIEFSGIVEEVGAEVRSFKKGDQVYGTTTGLKKGAYAEYVCIPEKWKWGVIAHKPKELSLEEAAALPVGAMTALELLTKAKISAGDQVLITGASGNVGNYAVQIAHYYGARITAVCGTANTDWVKATGADEVVDYKKQDVVLLTDRFDIVFEASGRIKHSLLKPLVKKKGRFISVKSLTSENNEKLTSIHKMIEAGKLRPVIDRVYPLDQIVDAHSYFDQGKKGNVVIEIAGSL